MTQRWSQQAEFAHQALANSASRLIARQQALARKDNLLSIGRKLWLELLEPAHVGLHQGHA